MLAYIIVFLLGLLVIYKLSSALSGALLNTFVYNNGDLSSGQLNDVQELFFRTVFTLLGYVAKRDGAINTKEVKRTETYMEKMELDNAHKREAIRLFKLGAQPNFNVEKTIEKFQRLAQKSPNLVQILLVYLINLARVDGALVNKEIDAVQKVALGLGYTDITFKHLLQMVSSQNKFGIDNNNNQSDKNHQSNKNTENIYKENPEQKKTSNTNQTDTVEKAKKREKSCEEQTRDFNNRSDQLSAAYEVFNLPATASDLEIRKSYRNLVNQYHPDKLIGLGLPPYMIQSATECFQKIQAAYNYIKEARK